MGECVWFYAPLPISRFRLYASPTVWGGLDMAVAATGPAAHLVTWPDTPAADAFGGCRVVTVSHQERSLTT